MKWLLMLFLCLPAFGNLQTEIRSQGLPALAVRTDQALSRIVTRAVAKLRERGFEFDASWIEQDYADRFDGYLSSGRFRDIGDHKPLSEWLAKVMKVLEADLGFQTCKLLHLTDIDVFNYGIPVVFHPCDFPMDNVTVVRQWEYSYHFSDSPKYGPALVPVVAYWVTDIGCAIGTSGNPACMVIASGVEMLFDKVIAPPLSNLVFNRNCL